MSKNADKRQILKEKKKNSKKIKLISNKKEEEVKCLLCHRKVTVKDEVLCIVCHFEATDDRIKARMLYHGLDEPTVCTECPNINDNDKDKYIHDICWECHLVKRIEAEWDI